MNLLKAFTRFLRRLSGVSTPLIGVSWSTPKEEREFVYRLMQELSGRRLFSPNHALRTDGGRELERSVETMRDSVTGALAAIDPRSEARPPLERMRSSLIDFQNLLEDYLGPDLADGSPKLLTLTASLIVMRDTLYKEYSYLANYYDIPFEHPKPNTKSLGKAPSESPERT